MGESTSCTSLGIANRLDATMGHSTGYTEVDAVLAELLAGVQGTIGRTARGGNIEVGARARGLVHPRSVAWGIA
jgi:hypothetical protein